MGGSHFAVFLPICRLPFCHNLGLFCVISIELFCVSLSEQRQSAINNLQPNGYQETIQKGVASLWNFSGTMSSGIDTRDNSIAKLKKEIATADAIVIGAGAGLSTAAGFTYSGERFDKYFYDFSKKYGFKNMYIGGFYPYQSKEEFWAYWARYIYINRYMDAPKPVYNDLCQLVKDKDYYVITTNVDHCFQKAGFDKKRLFYTQGDYGLFQSINPAIQETFDNEEWVTRAIEAQGFRGVR